MYQMFLLLHSLSTGKIHDETDNEEVKDTNGDTSQPLLDKDRADSVSSNSMKRRKSMSKISKQ